MKDDTQELRVSSRISRRTYADILKRQKETSEKFGFEPKLSTMIRVLIEEGLYGKKKKK